MKIIEPRVDRKTFIRRNSKGESAKAHIAKVVDELNKNRK